MSTESQLRERLCEVGRRLYQRGLCPGTSGNLSARLEDTWLLTPTNSCLGELLPRDISLLDFEGNHLSGKKPSKESFMHLAYYQHRPEARAVVHLHSTYAVAVSCLQDLNADSCVPFITPYFVMRIGDLPVVPYLRPGDARLGEEIASRAANHVAVLLANHGPVVSGKTLDEAVNNAEELEEGLKVYFLLQDKKPMLLTPEQVEALRRM
ncbi:3-oxo-tetronate 4-phosphate decarboxylase [Deinococcus cellulosilyticus]|uniref:3-oxo-tetronate 4-phosphate decarboxylase n=1 Tax=Deinococcus cellulosilyticus (strain DSM 18568 / NBRC 106333 / KACC 11606 / 5516J-15) TaxID=1223518 RepID=A0A511N2Z9_DEIC1|nr:aldolase [Deinococcus cellulosilyticus]GEM47235.1 class II aldolase [Deinococcus cellulosilyticus NBRC 106333 = KACC 11606]